MKNREWLNRNETRNFPIQEGLDRTAIGGYILPNDFIVDIRLSGTKSFVEISPTVFNNVDYFIYEVERIGLVEIQLRIREIHRETYTPGDSSTFADIGQFVIPFGQAQDQMFNFQEIAPSTVRGKLTIRNPLGLFRGNGALTLGVKTFTPLNTALEPRTLVPSPGDSKVYSISKEGDAFKAFGDVRLREEQGIEIAPVTSSNGLRFDFNALKECETLNADGGCLGELDVNCPQPAVMSLNKLSSDRNFNFKIGGSNSINVSTLPVLIPGGNPLNPNDYTVNSIVATYHGPITTSFLGGDPGDFNNYTYGLNCKHTPIGQRFPSLMQASQSLLAKLNSIVGNP